MGVMCSLLGHDYGDTDVERERAEQGDEVVRTAKRVKRCHNCGHERTVSENKEVTTLEAAAGVVREPDGTVVAATDGMGEVNGNIVIETEETTSPLDTPDTGQTDGNESADESVADIDEIRPLEHERHDTGPNRAPGEWPEEPETERLSKPETRESAGLDSSGSLATELRGDRWPDETSAPAEAAEESSGLLTMRNTESESETATSTRTSDRRPGNTFACSSCGFTSVVTDSPLRAGDICPGCGHGYLAWETRKG